MSNPEKGIYLGHLCQDLDLLFFKEFNTFGIFFSDKPITYKEWTETGSSDERNR